MIVIPPCAVVTASADGRVTRLTAPDTPVSRGEVVATVECGAGVADLHAPASGVVGGALAGPNQAVRTGDAVLWLARP